MKKRSATRSASSGAELGWAATSTLLGGVLVWGGVGWLLDHWWGTHFLTPIGVILGMALGIYAVVMRYGRAPLPEQQTRQTDPATGTTPASLER
jgi:F0F1-type ATP synthase assembly protein I